MIKEKEYKIVYETKITSWDYVPQLIIAMLFLWVVCGAYPIFKQIMENSKKDVSGISLLSVLGYIFLMGCLIYFIGSFISNVNKEWKQRDGNINKEELSFKGNNIEIQEIISPKEVKQRRIKYKTIYKEK